MDINDLINKIRNSPHKAFFIGIPLLLVVVIILINVFRMTRQNSEIATGVDVLKNLETRDVYTMEEKIDFMNHKSVDAGDYANLFDNSVIFGDSIAEGIGLYGYLPSSSLIAVMGKSTDTSLEDVPKLVAMAPRYVFFELGLNDMSHPATTLESYIQSYEKLIDAVKTQLPNTQIYICSVFPVTDAAIAEDSRLNQVDAYNAALVEMAKRKNVHYIDTYTVLKNNSQYHEADGIHVLREFYPLWLDTLVNNSDLAKLLQNGSK